ncbi:hypothetical protein GF376_05230 [Candidatus Peregrinibacteria bacterium]|nr:hypothetical protein [Candidatus Peregrinibacteria bacterium]
MKKKLKFKLKLVDIYRYLVYATIFLFPFKIQTVIYQSDLFSGVFNHFAVTMLTLTELLMLSSIALFGILYSKRKITIKYNQKQKKIFIAVLIFLLFVLLSNFFAKDSLISFLVSIRWLLLAMFLFILTVGTVDFGKVKKLFVYSLLLQALIAILQFFFQQSLGLKILGESMINIDLLNVAKIELSEQSVLRAYGTFSHPNVLAAALIFAIAFLVKYKSSKKYFLIAIFLFAFILTFSRTALIALIGFFITLFSIANIKVNYKYLILFGLLALLLVIGLNLDSILIARIFDLSALNQRGEYLLIGMNILQDNLFGVGIGNFILNMNEYSSQALQPWLLMPVHNIFLLAFAEVGLLGGLAFIAIHYYVSKFLADGDTLEHKTLFSLGGAIVIMSLFDHFFFTLMQGQFLLLLYLAFVINALSDNSSIPSNKI